MVLCNRCIYEFLFEYISLIIYFILYFTMHYTPLLYAIYRHLPDSQLASLLSSLKIASNDVKEITQVIYASHVQGSRIAYYFFTVYGIYNILA